MTDTTEIRRLELAECRGHEVVLGETNNPHIDALWDFELRDEETTP